MVKKPAPESPYAYAPYNPLGTTPRRSNGPYRGAGVTYDMSGDPSASTRTPGSEATLSTPVIGMGQYIANLNARTPENIMNQAAMRAYMRNAPYMQDLISSPDKMISEMRNLQEMLQQNPNDPVSEYRFRILRQAMGDVYGVQPPGGGIHDYDRPSYPVAPMPEYMEFEQEARPGRQILMNPKYK